MTFRAYGQTWLRDRRLKPRTRERYEHLLRRYLLPEFGQEVLSSITPPDVRRWRAQLDGLTPIVNARACALLKAILNTAVAGDEIAANPCRIRSATAVPRAREIRPATRTSWHSSWRPYRTTDERSVAWVSRRPVVGSPKSAAGRRAVAVPTHVLPAR